MRANTHFICPNCDKTFAKNFFPSHMRKEHNASEVEIMLFQMRHSNTYGVEEIPDAVLKPYLESVYKRVGKLERYKMAIDQFRSFYRSIVLCREFKVEDDLNYFFAVILPWKKEHPGQGNSRELCDLTYPDNKEFADKMYHDLMLVKNPYYKHDGSLSPFSKDFIGYKNLNEDEKAQKIAEAVKLDVEGRQSTTVEYWMQRKGLSEDEAKAKLKDRQTTFSKEKCIQKYGAEEGLKVWKARQEKWQATLKSKPVEEIERINALKSSFCGYSKLSQTIFNELMKRIDLSEYVVNYATNGESNKNNEYKFTKPDGTHYYFDFCIPELKCVIEFDGDYWHGKMGNKQREAERDRVIISSGFHLLHIKEVDYNKNNDAVFEKCIDFINECKQNRKENEII